VKAHINRPSGQFALKHKAYNHEGEDLAAETRLAII
jgi:hypothetical protein